MASPLRRLLEEAQAADRALWEHLETAYAAWYVGTAGDAVGTATVDAELPEDWRKRRDELREAAKRAHDAWLSYEPPPGMRGPDAH